MLYTAKAPLANGTGLTHVKCMNGGQGKTECVSQLVVVLLASQNCRLACTVLLTAPNHLECSVVLVNHNYN